MLTLLLCTVLGCDQPQRSYSYSYGVSYAPTYYARSYVAPKTIYGATPAYQYQQSYLYQQPYQAPAYVSVVGEYLRQESEQKERAEQSAKFDRLMELLEKQAQAPPSPPQFQAPPPQYATPQYPQAMPQAPPKSTPQFRSSPVPAPQYPAPPFQGDVPPPPVAPPKSRPSFGDAYTPGVAYGGTNMASVIQNRCASCHTGTSEKGGGVKLVEHDGRLADLGAISEEIIDATRSGRMPKGAPRLQPAEMLALYAGLMGLPQGTPVASSGR